jgi:flagellar protein FlaG
MSDLILPTGLTNSVGGGVVINKPEKPYINEAKVTKSVETQIEQKKVETSSVEAQAEKRSAVKEVEAAEEQKAIEEVALKLQEFVNLIDKKLQFTVDDNSGRRVVTVSDKLSGDVIRQIPSEEVLRLARNLSDLADIVNHSGKIIETQV